MARALGGPAPQPAARARARRTRPTSWRPTRPSPRACSTCAPRARVAGPRHPVLRARGRARPRLRAGPPPARRRPTTSRPPTSTMPELHERAIASLRRAIALRPDLAEAWRELGGAARLRWDARTRGSRPSQRALALDPDGRRVPRRAGPRATSSARRTSRARPPATRRRWPLNPQAGWSALQLAHCAALLRDFARGEAAARQRGRAAGGVPVRARTAS